MTVTIVPDFSQARVLVVGDVMLDRYWYGAASRISPEAPVPVVHVGSEEDRPGGAGNVALNLLALGAQPALLGATGVDAAAETLERKLSQAGVACRFQRIPGVPTVTKLRVLSRQQQLIRLDFESRFPGFERGFIQTHVPPLLAEAGALVLSDYGKGTLTDCQTLIDMARAAGKPVVVDPKRPDFADYQGATLVTPNLAELEAVVGPCGDEATLVERGSALVARNDHAALLITRGEHGMTLLRADRPPLHLPAHAREVFDVTGAGDTVVATIAAALATGADLPNAVSLANWAASIVVGKLGTATASLTELRAVIQPPAKIDRGMVTEEQLLDVVASARAMGEQIVMTNGCFDLLHAGHVRYLEQAREMGDRLIVAVNDDASVRRLKGTTRPINALDRRMAVLSALSAVDWVVPFAEDTPERLICVVRPDVLVKGGDYRPEQVAGRECVESAGGLVSILPLTEGCSTSSLLSVLGRRPAADSSVGT